MYRLLALDMDGTLLNKQKVITPKVKEEIRRLVFKGVFVTLASGRFPPSVWLHANFLGLNFPLIALNGAIILDPVTGEKRTGIPIPADVARKLAIFAEQKKAYIHFYGYHTLYVEQLNEMNRAWPLANVVVDPYKELTEDRYREQVNMIQVYPVGRLSDFLADNRTPVYKATVIHDNPESAREMYEELRTWNELTVSMTGKRRFDINANGVSKKAALQKICEQHSISAEEVVAVGDYDNDVDMLQWAGLGIALENGSELAKKAAKVVTKSNEEDGVAVAIQTYF